SALELVRAAAAAGLLRRGNIQVEAAPLQPVDEVQLGVFQVQLALLVDDHRHAEEVELAVRLLVIGLVDLQAAVVAAASPGDQPNPQERFGSGTLDVLLRFAGGRFGKRNGHCSSPLCKLVETGGIFDNRLCLKYTTPAGIEKVETAAESGGRKAESRCFHRFFSPTRPPAPAPAPQTAPAAESAVCN